MADIDELAKNILADVLADFRTKNLGSEALEASYEGLAIPTLKEKYEELSNPVDFDLAITQLEGKELIGTGPMEFYDNKPGQNLLVISLISKREYIYLKEKGYRTATKLRAAPSPKNTLHISGGTFHQSPIGIGNQVSQQVNVENITEVQDRLLKLLIDSGGPITATTKGDIEQMIKLAGKGDIKIIFKRVFHATTDAVKEVAAGIIAAYISKQLGI